MSDLPPLHASPAALATIANALNQHTPVTPEERKAMQQGQAFAEAMGIIEELGSDPSRDTIDWLRHRAARLLGDHCRVHCCSTCEEEAEDAKAEAYAARCA